MTVLVEDAFGNLVDSSAGVSVVLAGNPGGATLGGVTTMSAVHGAANFSGLTLSKKGSGYTLSADSGGLATFVGALQTAKTDEQVIAAIIGSPEYFQRV